MEKKPFNTENIIEVIDAWTDETVERKLEEQKMLLTNKLVPELKMELAVMEMQEKILTRYQSDHDVRNLAARFVMSLKGGRFEDALNCFALETEGTMATIEKYGIYKGKNQLKAYFVDYYSKIGGSEGCFIEHELTSPVVEVAEDCKSAKAMFMSEGILAIDPDGSMGPDDVARSFWQIGPWYMECVKENDEWKIWHLTIFDEIEIPYEQSWSEFTDHESLRWAAAPAPDEKIESKNYFTPDRKPFLHMEPPCMYENTCTKEGMSC